MLRVPSQRSSCAGDFEGDAIFPSSCYLRNPHRTSSAIGEAEEDGAPILGPDFDRIGFHPSLARIISLESRERALRTETHRYQRSQICKDRIGIETSDKKYQVHPVRSNVAHRSQFAAFLW